jgi:hypothetical protein
MSASDTPRSGRAQQARRSQQPTARAGGARASRAGADEPTQVLRSAGTATAEPPPTGAPAPEQPSPEAGRGGRGRRGRGRSRKARLVLARVDPWSVMKLSFLLSIALAIILVTAVFVIWSVLDRLEVFTSLATTIREVTESETNPGFDLMKYVGLNRVLGVAGVIACVNIVLVTALATLGAFLYNLATGLVGGLHVTLSEDA